MAGRMKFWRWKFGELLTPCGILLNIQLGGYFQKFVLIEHQLKDALYGTL